mmetsp:Transcript_742/g.3048  ORF Transcript_742/g.3048 Transcript_742/m.3048 type:complete len:273 (+) Transcript_742:711-1529(+)
MRNNTFTFVVRRMSSSSPPTEDTFVVSSASRRAANASDAGKVFASFQSLKNASRASRANSVSEARASAVAIASGSGKFPPTASLAEATIARAPGTSGGRASSAHRAAAAYARAFAAGGSAASEASAALSKSAAAAAADSDAEGASRSANARSTRSAGEGGAAGFVSVFVSWEEELFWSSDGAAAFATSASASAGDMAPTTVSTSFPSRMVIVVGSEVMRNSSEMPACLSTSILTSTTEGREWVPSAFNFRGALITASSSSGVRVLHGPHHWA